MHWYILPSTTTTRPIKGSQVSHVRRCLFVEEGIRRIGVPAHAQLQHNLNSKWQRRTGVDTSNHPLEFEERPTSLLGVSHTLTISGSLGFDNVPSGLAHETRSACYEYYFRHRLVPGQFEKGAVWFWKRDGVAENKLDIVFAEEVDICIWASPKFF